MKFTVGLKILTILFVSGYAFSFDASQFVKSLVVLRSEAETCSRSIFGQTLSGFTSVDSYFKDLGQPLPNLVDPTFQASLRGVVKQHAAFICKKRLEKSHYKYLQEAKRYMIGKPDTWPDAPVISLPKWCSDQYCSNLQ